MAGRAALSTARPLQAIRVGRRPRAGVTGRLMPPAFVSRVLRKTLAKETIMKLLTKSIREQLLANGRIRRLPKSAATRPTSCLP